MESNFPLVGFVRYYASHSFSFLNDSFAKQAIYLRCSLFPQLPRSQMSHRLPSRLVLLSVISLASCGLVNVTVDDAGLDPLTGATFSYSPTDHWSQGNGCEQCQAQLDPSQVHGGTWHDTTYDALTPIETASFEFTGE